MDGKWVHSILLTAQTFIQRTPGTKDGVLSLGAVMRHCATLPSLQTPAQPSNKICAVLVCHTWIKLGKKLMILKSPLGFSMISWHVFLFF